jgi:hypothetical protein
MVEDSRPPINHTLPVGMAAFKLPFCAPPRPRVEGPGELAKFPNRVVPLVGSTSRTCPMP